jgi:hypothetical protein
MDSNLRLNCAMCSVRSLVFTDISLVPFDDRLSAKTFGFSPRGAPSLWFCFSSEQVVATAFHELSG